MNLHHLKYFLAIAELGTISAASKKLLVGQPALSAQLKQFEEWLGMPLFHRHGKRLQLTQEGEYVMKYARAIKDLEEELLLNVNHIHDQKSKELTIAVQEVVPKSIVARALDEILGKEKFRLRIIEGRGDDLLKLLLDGKADILIGNFKPMFDGKKMVSVSLGQEPVSIWGGKNFIHLRKGFPASLAGVPFLLTGFQSPLRHEVEKFFLEHAMDLRVLIEAQDLALLKELSSRGRGLIALGDFSAKEWVKGQRLIRIGRLKAVQEEYWVSMVGKSLDNDTLRSILKRINRQ